MTSADQSATPEAGAPICVAAEGNVEMLDVRVLHEELCRALDEGGPAHIDLSAVTKIGTGALQVLVAFVRDADAQKVPYEWTGASKIVVNAAREAGLTEHLHLPDPSLKQERG